jgi:hypothetical protein
VHFDHRTVEEILCVADLRGLSRRYELLAKETDHYIDILFASVGRGAHGHDPNDRVLITDSVLYADGERLGLSGLGVDFDEKRGDLIEGQIVRLEFVLEVLIGEHAVAEGGTGLQQLALNDSLGCGEGGVPSATMFIW